MSLTEALDLTTPAGRAMAGLLCVFAEFEREILRERVCAGLAHARQQGKRLGRPPSVVHRPSKSGSFTAKASANPRSPASLKSAEPRSAASWPKRNPNLRSLAGRTRSSADKSCARWVHVR